MVKFRIWLAAALLAAGCTAPLATPSPTAPTASWPDPTPSPTVRRASATPTPLSMPSPTPTAANTKPLDFVLVFSEFSRILSLAGEGKLVQLVNEPDLDLNISLSPDGQWLAYQRSSERRSVWLVNTQPGSQPTSYSLEDIIPLGSRMLGRTWTADSRELRFAFGVAGNSNRLLGFGALERAGGKARLLLDLKGREVSGRLVYAPDGKYAALASLDRIYLANLENGQLTRDLVTFEPFSRTSDASTWLPTPQWNPDSTAFWAAVPAPLSSWEKLEFRLLKVNIAEKIEPLPNLPGTYRGDQPPDIYFSPLGNQVLYSAADGLRWRILQGGLPEAIFGWKGQVVGFIPGGEWCLVQRDNGGLALLNWRGEVRDIKLPDGSVPIEKGVAWLNAQDLIYALHRPDGVWALYRQSLEGEPQLLIDGRQDQHMQLFQGSFTVSRKSQ